MSEVRVTVHGVELEDDETACKYCGALIETVDVKHWNSAWYALGFRELWTGMYRGARSLSCSENKVGPMANRNTFNGDGYRLHVPMEFDICDEIDLATPVVGATA